MFTVLFFLLFAHYLADFPWQNDFLAQAKNPDTAIGKDIWKHALFGHCMIHAGLVAYFTHSVVLGLFELVIHGVTDYTKNKGRISFNTDQFIHIGCKVVWATLVGLGIS